MNNSDNEASFNCFKIKITEKPVICGDDIFTTYGLKFEMKDGTVDIYDDITYTKTKICELYSLLTENNVDESHIYDIICDFVDSLHCL